jgi:hypothetical protein
LELRAFVGGGLAQMDFELVGDVIDVETIATGQGIRELPLV